jgi:AraC family transcriptional regulator, regulatory protein of adaptative response / methylated-DNA-[protein]-cysteine methyltransferase
LQVKVREDDSPDFAIIKVLTRSRTHQEALAMNQPTLFETDDERWRAIELREASADGSFVYGVRTTGVYCRPSCRSRRPNRANVRFFEGTEAAERAGFRACKRCEPENPKCEDGRAVAIARACSLIERADSIPSLAELAAEVGLSVGYFHRLFKNAVGLSPREFAMSVRTERLRQGLVAGGSVTGAILGAGFGSIGRAYEESGASLGMTPGEYRQGAKGLAIRYATAETSLGWVLVAATDRGLCSIALGDSTEGLVNGLVERFPQAELAGDDADFADQLRQVVAMVEAPRLGLDLPLDIRGTAFQRQVWEALRAIPAGSTVTYAEVARSIGRPSSVRAVANACGSNELAVVIPCHRVVRGDGGLGGYRWGIARKRALIDEESKGENP